MEVRFLADALLYIHGKNGSADEAEHFKKIFDKCDIVGLDYKGKTPWDAGMEIKESLKGLKTRYGNVTVIANSIGAFFTMSADVQNDVDHAFFISPVVDMEKIISGMMTLEGITEAELCERGAVQTKSGDVILWDYLCYVREHKINWKVPTDVLYGEKDNITTYKTIESFAKSHNASLTVMKGGEHWFHTEDQLDFLDRWIKRKSDIMIAYCGIDCSKCDAYIATAKNDDALREKTAKLWSDLNHTEILPKQINCEGCRTNGAKTLFCENLCSVRRCASKKGVATCGDCSKMKNCAAVGAIISNNIDALKNLNG